MPTINQIKEMIHIINPALEPLLLKMKEIPELENFLHDDEEILRITKATSHGKDYVHPGVFVATNTRCFFFYKGGLITKVTAEQFPYDKISRVSFHSGMISADLFIESSGASIVKLEYVAKNEVQELCDFLNAQARTASAQSSEPIPSTSNSADDMISQLERLASLKSIGALTDDEFSQAKAKLLSL